MRNVHVLDTWVALAATLLLAAVPPRVQASSKGTKELGLGPVGTTSFGSEAGSGSMESAAPKLPMRLSVAFGAQSDQVLLHITARMTTQFEVMDLQLLHTSARLAAPPVARHHLPMQLAIARRIKSEARALGTSRLHDALRATSDRKVCC